MADSGKITEDKKLGEGKRAALIMLVQLALPVIAQQILSSILQYVDTAMVGHLGEAATASVSTSTSVNWLIHSLGYGCTIGILSLTSQAYGRGDKNEIKRLAALGLRLAIIIGLSLTVISLAISPFLPTWMQAAPEIRPAASSYFFIVSTSLLFFALNSMCASCMQAIKDTRTPMIVNIIANVTNVMLNWLLIYQFRLGTNGAGLATAISTTIGGVLMFIAFRRKPELSFPLREVRNSSRKLLDRVMEIALPVTATSVVSCMGYIVFAGMVSGMGVTNFAAHSIALTAEELFYIPGYGIRTATSTLIGIAIGEKNRRKFLDVRTVSLRLTILLMCINGTVLHLFAAPLMRLFTNSQDVITLGAQLLRMVAFIEPFFGVMVVWEGISYGTGRTKAVFVIETISMWGIRILSTAVVIRAGYGLQQVWLCMMADNIFKAIALTIYGLRSTTHLEVFAESPQTA